MTAVSSACIDRGKTCYYASLYLHSESHSVRMEVYIIDSIAKNFVIYTAQPRMGPPQTPGGRLISVVHVGNNKPSCLWKRCMISYMPVKEQKNATSPTLSNPILLVSILVPSKPTSPTIPTLAPCFPTLKLIIPNPTAIDFAFVFVASCRATGRS